MYVIKHISIYRKSHTLVHLEVLHMRTRAVNLWQVLVMLCLRGNVGYMMSHTSSNFIFPV